MQYLLTEAEYDALSARRQNNMLMPDVKSLQDFCTKVADELPVKGWHTRGGGPQPWGCIITATQEWYCDECPAQGVCPHPHKEWSK